MKMVNIILNGNFGGGFSDNWGFDEVHKNQELAQAVLDKDEKRFDEIAKGLEYTDKDGETYELFYSFRDLYVVTIPKFSKFIIREYDGQESLVLESDMQWEIA